MTRPPPDHAPDPPPCDPEEPFDARDLVDLDDPEEDGDEADDPLHASMFAPRAALVPRTWSPARENPWPRIVAAALAELACAMVVRHIGEPATRRPPPRATSAHATW